jgi:hypothetical protein
MTPLYTSKNHKKPQPDFDDDEPVRPESYSKQQHMIIKELIEAGVSTVVTHYCLNCYNETSLLLWR